MPFSWQNYSLFPMIGSFGWEFVGPSWLAKWCSRESEGTTGKTAFRCAISLSNIWMCYLSFKYQDAQSRFQLFQCAFSLSKYFANKFLFERKMAQLPKNDHRCIHHNKWSCGLLNNMDQSIIPKIPKGCSSFKRIMLLIICVTRCIAILHNVLFVHYVLLPTEQAETYPKIHVSKYHSTYNCPSLFDWKENMIFEETVNSKL